ncbi:MAG: PepSY domain-containing protein [Nitrospirales bacterium]|nr:PepSY domain-containing protein [Nitrospira sp.]MDR4500636.1 PepSY domain-containing protein [Nitrospirales bacterium]
MRHVTIDTGSSEMQTQGETHNGKDSRGTLRRPGLWALMCALVFFGWTIPLYAAEELLPYDQLKTKFVPIEQVLSHVNRSFEGIILEVELEEDDETWIYEVKLLTPQGNVLEVEYDAQNMDLLTVKGKRDSAAQR